MDTPISRLSGGNQRLAALALALAARPEVILWTNRRRDSIRLRAAGEPMPD